MRIVYPANAKRSLSNLGKICMGNSKCQIITLIHTTHHNPSLASTIAVWSAAFGSHVKSVEERFPFGICVSFGKINWIVDRLICPYSLSMCRLSELLSDAPCSGHFEVLIVYFDVKHCSNCIPNRIVYSRAQCYRMDIFYLECWGCCRVERGFFM
jgi:hypothetical protein